MFKKVFFSLMLLCIGTITTVFCSYEVSALELNHNSEIYKKVIRQNIKACYRNEPLANNTFPKDWPSGDFKGLFGDATWVTLPTGYTTTLADDYKVSCKGLMYGESKFGLFSTSNGYAGILDIYGKNISDETGLIKKEELAVGLGYEEAPEEPDNLDTPLYYALKYTYMKLRKWRGCGFLWLGLCEETTGPHDAATYVTGTKVNSDGTVGGDMEVFSSGNGVDLNEAGISFKENGDKSGGTLSVKCEDFKKSWGELLGEVLIGAASFNSVIGFNCVDGSLSVSYDKTIWNDGDANNGSGASEKSIVGFLNKHLPINFSIEEERCSDQYCMTYHYEKRTFTFTGTISNDPSYVGEPTNITLPGQYNKIGGWDDRASKGMMYFTGGTNRIFTDAEIYVLYVGYLTDYYKADFQCGADKAEFYAGREGYIRASNLLYDSQMQDECYVKATTNADKKVNGVSFYTFDGADRGGGMVFHGQKTFEELLAQIAGLDVTPESIAEANISPTPEGDEGGSGQSDPCFKEAGALGWVLCPIISGLSDLGSKAYKWVENNFLQIRASIFSDSTSGVESAWKNVRDIANVGFAIMLLVVIFSQITGVGIDNYGIKKILPKLIVCAIVINLSYVVCQILVDLSNIFGKGLNDLLSGMGPALSVNVNNYEASGWQSATVWGTGVVGVAIIMIVSYGGLGAIMMLFLALLACVIAVIMLFAILVIRQAGVVVCVIIAPIAILCYLLPNTEKVYKKWFSLLKGLLLVYPICGLVVGAGDFMSRIFGNLAASGNDWTQLGFALGAMIVQVLPYFFIPAILKGSLAAMGDIGAKISRFGRGLSGRAGKAIKGSDAMKMSHQRANENRMMRKAGINSKTGELTARGRMKARFAKSELGKRVGYSKFQSSRIQAAEKIRGADIGATASLTNAIATSEMANKKQTPDAYYEDQLDKAAKAGDITAYESAIEAAVSSGQLKDKDIARITRNTIGQMQASIKDDGVRQNFYRKLAAKHGNSFLGTDFELRHWMQNSGTGVLGNYGDYAASHIGIEDVKPEDVLKLSGDSLAGMISAGKIDQGMAKRIMAMNPNMSADKRIMMGALANGAVGAGVNVAQFKADATALASNSHAVVSTITPTGSDDLATLVSRWTAPTAQRTTIVQEFYSDSDKQLRPVDIQEAGTYADPAGNIYRIRRTQDGRHIDDAGFEVDISKFHPR